MNPVRHMLVASCALAALCGAAQAKDRAMPAEVMAKSAAGVPIPIPAESIGVTVYAGRDPVWTGALRIGGPYGSASFSQSKSEFAVPCASEKRPDGYQATSSENLSVNISRYNWQQEPDRFSVNLNWSRPVLACQGEGNDSFGFNRVLSVPRGQSVTVEGSGGMSVKLTRSR